MEKKWIYFRGTNRLREGEVFQLHDLKLNSGYMYPVTPELFTYLKSIRGFEEVKGVGSEKTIDFPTVIKDERSGDKKSTKKRTKT